MRVRIRDTACIGTVQWPAIPQVTVPIQGCETIFSNPIFQTITDPDSNPDPTRFFSHVLNTSLILPCKCVKGSDQRKNRWVWSNVNTRYLVWRCGDGGSFAL